MKTFINKHLELILLALAGVFSFWLMFSTFGYSDGHFVIDSKLYSDFGAHLPLIRSFSMGGNFPHPEYPFFHGEPIRYHYLFYLVVGLMERLGVNLALALNLLSALGFWLLLVMIYKLAKLFFKRVEAGVLAILLFLFNGSFSWVEYFNKQGWTLQALLEIPKQVQFASFGPWSGRLVSAFWSLNIYTNQRHLGLSYGLALWLIYLVVKTFSWQKTQPLKLKLKPLSLFTSLAAIMSLALFPLLHQAGYVMFGLFFILWLLVYSLKYWQRKKETLRYFLPFIIGGVLSLVVFKFFTTGSSQPVTEVPGYLALDKTLVGILQYWWFNLGLYLLLFPILLIFSLKRKNALLVIFSFFFIIANLVRLSPDMINNHKLVTMFSIGLNIFTAGWIITLAKGRCYLKRLLPKIKVKYLRFLRSVFLGVLTLFLMLGGLVDIWPIINDYSGKLTDYPQSPVMQLVIKETEPRAQILSNIYLHNPASLVGRQLYLDYGYFAWSMGYNDGLKRADLKFLFSSDISKDKWCQVAKKHEIDYVLLDPNLTSMEDGRINVRSSWLVNSTQPDWISSDGWRLWDVARVCFANTSKFKI